MRYCAVVRLISYRALREFADIHSQALGSLQGWRKVIEASRFENWSALKKVFNTVDKVGDLAVFNVGGNKYRLVAYLNFERQIIYVKAVMTHAEYDKGDWKS
jgi:mRNA interferase HigB